MSSPLLSLCIPTNGIIEWVFPVLDSIYAQNVDNSLFEVVVTDNGDNEEFYKKIIAYQKKYENLFYYKSSGYEFLSEPDSYKNAKGLFIKFINHRTKLKPGTLRYFIDWVEENKDEKPFIYFSNGVLNEEKVFEFSSFDEFVKKLSYWSSWSTGMAFWKETFDLIPKETAYNFLFPHTTILFSQRRLAKYIVDDNTLLEEISVSHVNKGKYNLFHAFAVEYMGIVCDLLRDGSISAETFLRIKKDNLKFIAKLYLDFVVLKHKCSYDLDGSKNALGVFYGNIKNTVVLMFCGRVLMMPVKIVRRLVKMVCMVEKHGGG